MKLQDVILRAMAKKLTWIQAAEIAGMSVRNLQRKRQSYQEFGYTGLFDQRRGKRSIHRVPMETAERVLALYQEKYFDFNVRHFHEKLRQEEGIRLSYSWVKQALQGAGLVARRRKRGAHRRRRPRRPLPGMMLHIDGSTHRWFQDDRYYDLIVILDDATSQIYYAQLVEEESTRTVMAGVREVIEQEGLFCTLYSDRGSHFFHTPKARGGGQEAPHAVRAGAAGAGDSDDCRLFAASAGTYGTQLLNLAGSPAARVAPSRHRQSGGGQLLPPRVLYREVQSELCGGSDGKGNRVPQMRTSGSGLDLLDSYRTGRKQGQHRGHRRPLVAD